MIKIQDNAAELKKVSTRKEGQGSETVLGLDLLFSCSTLGKKVTPDVLGHSSLAFWDENEEQDPIWLGINWITSSSRVKNATLQFCGIVLDHTVTLSAWKFSPRPQGMVDVHFKAAINKPTKEQRAGILEASKQPGRLEVDGELNLLDLMEAEAGAEPQSDNQLHLVDSEANK